MNWIFSIAIGVVLIFLYLNYQTKRKQKRLIQTLKEQWGKPRGKGYYNYSFIKRYFESHKNEASFLVISKQTANDLDFERLFEFLDHTTSNIGQQYLYKNLRIITGKDSLDKLQSLSSFLVSKRWNKYIFFYSGFVCRKRPHFLVLQFIQTWN